MGNIIGLFIVLCIVARSSNKIIDSRRVKKWFNEENNK
jgi:hypothetical protein